MKIVYILIILFILTACSTQEATFKIGVIGTLTSFGSYYGQQELKGIQLAVDEINANGGINNKQLELVVEDSASTPSTSVLAIQKLINTDQTKFIIGDSWTTTTVAMVPIANENEVILISPIASLDELSQEDFYFRTVPNIKDMMKPLAAYTYSQGYKRVGILQQQTAYGEEHAKDFKDSFEALGGTVTSIEKVSLSQADVKAELIKINKQNPDTIFNLHTSNAMLGLVMKQAKELDIEVNWIGSWGVENQPLIKEYPYVAEGLTYPFPYMGDNNQFVEAYRTKYNEVPSLTTANSYDALKVLALAIENVGEDPVKVKDYLPTIKDFNGGSGNFSFDQNGDIKKPIIIKQVKDGEFVVIE